MMTRTTVKLMIVAGARPNFMKIAPLMKQIERVNSLGLGPAKLEAFLVHTGQHYDPNMSDIFFRELGIPPPDTYLNVGSGTHAQQTALLMTGFEPVCNNENPDWVVVVGDVNSTMACTLVCSKMNLKVAHVEAGLRSFDRTMPEEVNRIVTDALADILFTPSEDANENLHREGTPGDRIRLVGNIMIDSLVDNLPMARQSGILQRYGLEPGRFIYVTLHRPSNVDKAESLRAIANALVEVAAKVPIFFPMHPRTRKMLEDAGIHLVGNARLTVTEPIGYHDSLCLAENARVVLTDSGGLQEETTYFRTPCLTLRPNTERPITVSRGSNRLTSLSVLAADLGRALAGERRLGEIPVLWDGKAAGRIIDALSSLA